MNEIMIDGIRRNIPLESESRFEDLLGYVQEYCVSETSVIASVKIDGVDIVEYDQTELARIPLEKLDLIEVRTAHPREIAEDTLQTLLPFCDSLARLSRAIAVEPETGDPRYTQLIDGIETLMESISAVKMTLRIGVLESVNVLEAELLSILKDILFARQNSDDAYLMDLLSEHLPNHLEQWRDAGIPALIRSRDS